MRRALQSAACGLLLAAAPEQAPAAAAEGPGLPLPAFAIIIEQARSDFRAATGSERQAEILAWRHAGTCAMVADHGYGFAWPARVVQVVDDVAGLGLQVEVAHWIFLTTDLGPPPSGALSSLIAPDTALATAVLVLQPGQEILLTGELRPGPQGCLQPYGNLEPAQQINPTTLMMRVEAVAPR